MLIDEERSTISRVPIPVCSKSFVTIKAGLPNSDKPLEPSPTSACNTVPKTALFSAITEFKVVPNTVVSRLLEDNDVSIVDKSVSCEAAAVALALDSKDIESSFDGSDKARAIPL